MSLFRRLLIPLLLAALPAAGFAETKEILKENIAKARPGDYIVTNLGKNFSLLHIRGKTESGLILEEVNAPLNRIPKNRYSWREWMEKGAPGNTSWVAYWVNTRSGEIERAYSFTKQCWFKLRDEDNFISTLLGLTFRHIPLSQRKRIGPKSSSMPGEELKNIWQPRMIVNSTVIPDVNFEAWKAKWPNDGSELAGKIVEIYLPEESNRYPTYFPYWLQVSGMVGKAKIRVVDSGGGLRSPKQL